MLFQSIDIGWRHFFPAYLFMLLFCTRVMSASLAWKWMGAFLAGGLAIDSLAWHPNYIAYQNRMRNASRTGDFRQQYGLGAISQAGGEVA